MVEEPEPGPTMGEPRPPEQQTPEPVVRDARSDRHRRPEIQSEPEPAAGAAPLADLQKAAVAVAGRARELGKAAATSLAPAAAGLADSARRWWRKAVDFSGVTDATHPRRTPVREPRPVPPTGPAMSVSPSGVGLLDYLAPPGEHLLEVSVLESLGFYDPSGAVVVAVKTPPEAATPAPAPPTPVVAPPARKAAPPRVPASSGSQVPDLDLGGWKPHVIARSKLGGRSVRLSSAGIVGLLLVVLAVLTGAVLRQPGIDRDRQYETVLAKAAGVADALDDLLPALEPDSAAEATASLVTVDVAARDLFDAAARLDAETQAELRARTISLAEATIQMEKRVTDLLTYRLVLRPLWRSPSLEGVADPIAAAEALATWQAQLADITGALPEGGELASHSGEVALFVEGLDEWRTGYLDALSIGDTEATATALADLEGQLAALAQSAQGVMARVITQTTAEAQTLTAQLRQLGG
jgi:hypothetical protein